MIFGSIGNNSTLTFYSASKLKTQNSANKSDNHTSLGMEQLKFKTRYQSSEWPG